MGFDNLAHNLFLFPPHEYFIGQFVFFNGSYHRWLVSGAQLLTLIYSLQLIAYSQGV